MKRDKDVFCHLGSKTRLFSTRIIETEIRKSDNLTLAAAMVVFFSLVVKNHSRLGRENISFSWSIIFCAWRLVEKSDRLHFGINKAQKQIHELNHFLYAANAFSTTVKLKREILCWLPFLLSEEPFPPCTKRSKTCANLNSSEKPDKLDHCYEAVF